MRFNFLSSANKLYFILAGAVGLVVILTVFLLLRSVGDITGRNRGESVTLQVWGVFDEPVDFASAIDSFEQLYGRRVRVQYTPFSFEEYERQLVNALAAGTGPDIFMLHHTWLPKHKDKMVAMPAKAAGADEPLLTVEQMKQEFVEVAVKDLVADGKIYALPLYVDTLALYYNRDLFNSAGFTRPPRNWEEFNDYVQRLTRLEQGRVALSAAALGTVKNINRSTDILMALMVQTGTPMTNSDNTGPEFLATIGGIQPGPRALQYYTEFANPRTSIYTWNEAQPYSIDAFSEGKVAMMFNYSHQVALIRSRAPRLNFAVAPMPQVSETDQRTYANYWALGVSNNTKNADMAWQFIDYMASRDGMTKYLTATNRPAARRDLVDLQKGDGEIGVFALQALTARSWYQVDNEAIENIFAEMIEDVNYNRADPARAMRSAESKVNVLMH